MEDSLPLNTCHVLKSSIITNRSHMVIHSIAIAILIHYRLSNILFNKNIPTLTPWILLFVSELLLSFQWFLNQAYQWRPVSRNVYPERLPENEKLPGIDVFICTVDPENEPTVGVMNTVISAMALDYPPEKLHVYVSDDGGFPVTLYGMKEALRFAKLWLPFCRRYEIKIGCPNAYLSHIDEDSICSDEFLREKKIIKEKYEMYKENIERFLESSSNSSRDHPAVIEIIQESSTATLSELKMPQLVYVSREKRRSHPHNFKSGALNALLRVSGIISNSLYILGLDCDMYCNDPTSAKQTMCIHLDPKLSPSIAYVQFPQRFHNINSQNDIYDAAYRSVWVSAKGMDGLEGPGIYGTNYYIKRKALYGCSPHEEFDVANLRSSFGSSNEFIESISGDYSPSTIDDNLLHTSPRNVKDLASCTYEDHTDWGEKVGFLYFSVAEDYFTSFNLHRNGWKSVFLHPSKPQFLGTATTNLNAILGHGTRWVSGAVSVGLSRFCPLIYRPTKTSFLQTMCYTEMTFSLMIHSLSLWCLAIIPQVCLLNGVSIYPQVSSPYFKVFSFIFISSLSKHLYDVLNDGGSILGWRNECRFWMLRSCTYCLYGTLSAIMKKLKFKEANFAVTNKADGDEKVTLYQKGMFDFRGSTVLLTPLVTLVILNMVTFVGGVVRVIMFEGTLDKMLVQLGLSLYVLVMSYAVIEGMISRKDNGRITSFVTMLSFFMALVVLSFGYVVLM